MRERKGEKLLQKKPHLIMGFDQVADSISAGYNFIVRNGLGTRLVSNNSGGMRDYYSWNSRRWNSDGSSYDYHESWQNEREDFWSRESKAFQKKYQEQMKCLSEGKIYITKKSVVLEDRLAYYHNRVNGAMFLTASQKEEKRIREEEELEFRKRLEDYEKRKANGWLEGRDYESEKIYAAQCQEREEKRKRDNSFFQEMLETKQKNKTSEANYYRQELKFFEGNDYQGENIWRKLGMKTPSTPKDPWGEKIKP